MINVVGDSLKNYHLYMSFKKARVIAVLEIYTYLVRKVIVRLNDADPILTDSFHLDD